ncbi:AMP-binding enzyme [Xylaria bambusicola]|uniref:AMP-binding enzyme n=1 Tax=Xylaria bambusicola TaxID=326684 RepID=UPI0020085D0F|nr:AMP-binding enzyme [Xylaria bambusicola]KAI0503431.1 AMP-binding enzyme [Xylaria bambusicola]
MATIVAGIAATAAGLTYLDGKYHIRQDVQMIRAKRKGAKMLQKAIKEKRISPYYFFERHARAQPSEECIWWRGGSYTWDAAYTRANQYAHFFRSQGVQANDLVSFFMINSPDFALAWMGLWAIGAAPALINHNLSQQALLHCLSIAESKLVLADGPEGLLARLDAVEGDLKASGVRVVKLSDVRSEIEALPTTRLPDDLRAAVTPASAFGLFYTSGTTGLPKACIVPTTAGFMHGAAKECGFAYVTPTSDNAALGRAERYYDCMPLYHGTGGISGMTQLLTGQTLCLAPKFSTSRFWEDVRASRATWFVYVGETLRYLLAAPPSPLDKQHSVRAIYGNGLRPDVWIPFRERFGIETIHEFFNSTEGILPLDNPARGDFRAHSVGHHGLLSRWRFHGILVPVAVDAETGDIVRDEKTGFATRVPYETGGEILVRQPPTITPAFPGYFKNEEATAKKFVYDVFRKGDCYYRTGDALRRDADGRWFFLDRLGDTFRWKGENVSTAEVSEVLGKYPGVSEATVYGVSVPGHDGKAGMAAIYINTDVSNFDYKGLLRHARDHLPKYAVPVFLRQLAARSATHNNKQDKVPLKKAGIDPFQMNGDSLLWISENGKGDDYMPFTSDEFLAIQVGQAKL